MLDEFSRAVVTADPQGAPLDNPELAPLRKYVADANTRIDATLAINHIVSSMSADAVSGMVYEST